MVESLHGHIALPLETITNLYMQEQDIRIQITADMIDCGCFVPVMLLLLCHKHGRTERVLHFAEISLQYIGIPAHQMPFREAKILFDEFQNCFKQDEIVY